MIREAIVLAGVSAGLIFAVLIAFYYLGLIHIPTFLPAGI